MMNEASLKNLKPYTRESARLNGRKGGIASVEAKRRKKTLRECAILFGETECNETMKQKLKECGIVDKEYLCNNMAIIYGLFQAGMRGNVGAVRLILELRGELNTRNMVTVTTTPAANPYAELSVDELRKLAGSDFAD